MKNIIARFTQWFTIISIKISLRRVKLFQLIEHRVWRYNLVACLLLTPMINYTMLRSLARSSRVNTPSTPQKRYIWSSRQLDELSNQPFSKTFEFSKFSPAHGAALINSNVLKNMIFMNISDPDPMIKVVKLLFFGLSETGEVRPTNNKSMAAYALESEILGLIMGALEVQRLKEEKVWQHIIYEWQQEYRKKTGEKKTISQKKIEELLNVISEAYQSDRDGLFSLLLAFLYAKANPENNHDMIHFLLGINEYIPVFSDEIIPITLKQEFPPVEKEVEEWESEQYEKLKTKLTTIPSRQRVEFAKENFPLAISLLIEEKRNKNYPIEVITGKYGYKGQEPVSDCFETALHNLFNFLLYNGERRRFDLSLLPPSLVPKDIFTNFYTKFASEKTANLPSCGQEFMDLVSGIPGVIYGRENYEIYPKYSIENIINICNYLFNINIDNLKDLSIAFSGDNRVITFTGKPTSFPIGGKSFDGIKIIITIDDTINNRKKSIHFCAIDIHAWIEVADKTQYSQKNLFDMSLLINDYVNPMVRSMFYLSQDLDLPSIRRRKLNMNPSAYYAFSTETDPEKRNLIRDLLNHHPNNIQAINYAYDLFKKLSFSEQLPITFFILTVPKFVQKLELDPEFDQEYTLFIARNVGNILNRSSSLTDREINSFYNKINNEELKKEIRDHLWNTYIPEDEKKHASLLVFILKGNLLGKDKAFDERFIQELKKGLHLSDEYKKYIFSHLSQIDIATITEQLSTDTEKILFLIEILKSKDILSQELQEMINEFFTKNSFAMLNKLAALVNKKEGKKTSLLHKAIEYGSPLLVRIVLSAGYKPYTLDESGQLPIYYARQLRDKGSNVVKFNEIIDLLGRNNNAAAIEKE